MRSIPMLAEYQDELAQIAFNLVSNKNRRQARRVSKIGALKNHREIAAAVIFDTNNRLLLQLRDNKARNSLPGQNRPIWWTSGGKRNLL